MIDLKHDEIYKLKLHEIMDFEMTRVLRVPGGWIYTDYEHHGGGKRSSCFVPFDNEFMTAEKAGD